MNGILNSLGLTDHAEDLRGCLYRIEGYLQEIRDSVVGDPDDRTDRTQRRMFAQGTASGAGFILPVGSVPAGGQWVITRVSVKSNAVAQGVRLWLDSAGGGVLVAKLTVDADGDFASDIGESPILTEGRQVVAEFLTVTATTNVRVDVQLDQLQDTASRQV